jgi:hypothetical protein
MRNFMRSLKSAFSSPACSDVVALSQFMALKNSLIEAEMRRDMKFSFGEKIPPGFQPVYIERLCVGF